MNRFILDINGYESTLISTYKLEFIDNELLSYFSYIEKENNLSIFSRNIDPCIDQLGVFKTNINFYGKEENIVTLGSNSNVIKFSNFLLRYTPICHTYETAQEKTFDSFFCTLKEGNTEIKLEFDRDDIVMITPNHCAVYNKANYITDDASVIGEPNKIIYFSRRGIETSTGKIKLFESINSHSYKYKLPLKETISNKLDRTALFDTLPTKLIIDNKVSYDIKYDKYFIVKEFHPDSFTLPNYCRYENLEWEEGEETIISIHPNFYDPFGYSITHPWEYWCKDKAIIKQGKIVYFERKVYKCNESFVIDIIEINKKYSNQLVCSDFFKK